MFRTATNCDVNLCFDSIVRPEHTRYKWQLLLRLQLKRNILHVCTWWSLSGMWEAPVGTGYREPGRGVAFPGNVNTAEPSPGPCRRSEPGLCLGTGSAECCRTRTGNDLILSQTIVNENCTTEAWSLITLLLWEPGPLWSSGCVWLLGSDP